MTLSGLVEKYNARGRRLTYSQLIQEIVAHNAEKVSRGMGRVSEARYRAAADRALGRGTLDMPAWDTVVPPRAFFLKKAMQGGEVISDTLRRRMTASMRAALESSPPGGQLDPAAVARLEAAVREAMAPYTRGTGGKAPPNAHTIAVTEARSAFDEAKYEYAKRMALVNTDRVSMWKVWRHNSHLVKVPRDGHLALNGVRVGFYESFTVATPSGTAVQMLHPHAPHAPIGEVAGCQCGYDIVVVPLQGLGTVGKSADVLKARGPVPKVGDVVTRPDGSKWVKTGTFSYRKATKAEEGTGRAAPGSEGSSPDSGTPEAPQAPGKAPTMTAEAAWGVLDRVGRGGFWNLTKDGLNEMLKAEGLDPSKMKFAEKKEAVYAAMDRRKARDLEENTVKVPPTRPYGCNSFTDLYGKVMTPAQASVESIKKYVKPAPGGHWGSAESSNATAVAVAFSSATKWRPIDKAVDGRLVEHKTTINPGRVELAVRLREYAQGRIKGLDRKEHPSLFRGMTLDPKDWESIRDGKSDTVELTGCTAFSCYEKIADRYSKSAWTKGFGRERRAVKIVLERDDGVDDSIGMWHQTFNEKHAEARAGRIGAEFQRDPAFELLSGLEAVRVVKVDVPEDVEVSKVKYLKSLQKGAGSDDALSLKATDKKVDFYKGRAEYWKGKADELRENPASHTGPDPIDNVLKYYDSLVKAAEEHVSGLQLDREKLVARMAEKKAVVAKYDVSDEHNAKVFHRLATDWELYSIVKRFGEEGSEGESLADFVGRDGMGRNGTGGRYTDGSLAEARSDQHLAQMKAAEAKVHQAAVLAMDGGKYDSWYRKLIKNPKAMVLHCIPGRGKKSVTGGNEGVGEEEQK